MPLRREDFFKKCIIPELIVKYFSAPKPAAIFQNHGQQWCYCSEPGVRNMLVCGSGFCSVQSFKCIFTKLAFALKEFLNSGYVVAAQKWSIHQKKRISRDRIRKGVGPQSLFSKNRQDKRDKTKHCTFGDMTGNRNSRRK